MLTGDGDTTFNVDRRAFSLALGSVAVMWPLTAEAHVKWFAEYDLDKPPLPVGEVLTGQFLYIFLISIAWMYAFFWVDRYALRKRILEDTLRRYTVSEPVAFAVMRLAALIFFAAVGIMASPVMRSFSLPN